MRHLISLLDFSKEVIEEIIKLTKKLKAASRRGKLLKPLEQKTLVMLFQKTSTRTRLSFEAAMTELGGHAIYLDARSTQLGLARFSDEIQAIMRFGQVLLFRARRAADVMLTASFHQIPVIDGCSEKYHPVQALSDLFTMIEHSGGLANIKKVVWLGIENNVSNSLKIVCAKVGLKLVVVSPEADSVSVDASLNATVAQSGCIEHCLNLESALAGADYLHTDTWLNMEYFENGRIKREFAKEYRRRQRLFRPYQLGVHLLKYAPAAKIMHCMPCHVGYEITAEAIEHPNSIILAQAENRLHLQKGLLVWLLAADAWKKKIMKL